MLQLLFKNFIRIDKFLQIVVMFHKSNYYFRMISHLSDNMFCSHHVDLSGVLLSPFSKSVQSKVDGILVSVHGSLDFTKHFCFIYVYLKNTVNVKYILTTPAIL